MPILERASAEAAGIADELRGAPRNQQGNNDTDDLIGQIQKLQMEVRVLRSQQSNAKDEVSLLKTQVSNRDSEIARLHTRLDVGGLNLSKLSREYQEKQQSEKVNLLNHQIDFLSRENAVMESTLRNQKTLGELGELNLKLQIQNTHLSDDRRTLEKSNVDLSKKFEIQYQDGRFAHSRSNRRREVEGERNLAEGGGYGDDRQIRGQQPSEEDAMLIDEQQYEDYPPRPLQRQ